MSVRLNLLRLLAYLDEVGNPEELAQLKQVVEESEPAKHLIETIRRAVRRTDLGAPPLLDEKYDLNRVSEYLDWTMPSENWAEFEQQVLHSEAMLAELASCHHGLKLVLAGPPSFDPGLRERLKEKVRDLLEHPPVTPPEPVKTHQVVIPPPPLDTSRLGSAPGLGETRPPEEVERIAVAVLQTAIPTPSGEIPAEPIEPAPPEPVSREIPSYLQDAPPALPTWLVPVGLTAGVLVLVGASFLLGQMYFTPQAVAVLPVATSGTPESTAGNGNAVVPSAEPVVPTVTPPVPTVMPTEVVPVPTAAPTTDPTAVPTTVPATTQAPTTPPATTGTAAPAATAPPAAAVEAAEFVTPDTIFAVLNPTAKDDAGRPIWNVLAPRTKLAPDTKFVVPPAMRAQLTFGGGLSAEFVGPTIGQVLAPAADGMPQLNIIDGRVILKTIKGGAKIRIATPAGKKSWIAGLTADNTTLAIEIRPLRAVGSDPATVPTTEVDGAFYLAEGSAAWDDGQLQVTVATAPAKGTLVPLRQTETALAVWVKGSDVSSLDVRSAKQLQGPTGLATEGSFEFRLREVEALTSAPETRTILLRTLALIGTFDRSVVAIAQDGFRQNYREQLVETMRSALAWGPEYAEAVQVAIVDPRRELPDAPFLYRMLWGFTDAQLAAGDAAKLVAGLDHANFLVRSLSFQVLKETTGVTLGYNPAQNETQRAKLVKAWRDRLDKGEIKRKAPGAA